MIFQFGSGVLLGSRTDIANTTPGNFGLIQEVQLDVSFTTKTLTGQFQFPVAVARGAGKITGKAKMAQISGLAFNNLHGAREARTLFAHACRAAYLPMGRGRKRSARQ